MGAFSATRRAPHPRVVAGAQIFSNSTVVALIVAWAAIGIVVHLYRFNEASVKARQIVDERSAAASANLAHARALARTSTPEEQLNRLRARYEAINGPLPAAPNAAT
jgi:hypothetical protein